MQLVTIKVDDYVTREFTWNDLWISTHARLHKIFFLTVHQETNTSRSPGRATKNIFLVARGQMLVASGDWALLEHSLGSLRLSPKALQCLACFFFKRTKNLSADSPDSGAMWRNMRHSYGTLSSARKWASNFRIQALYTSSVVALTGSGCTKSSKISYTSRSAKWSNCDFFLPACVIPFPSM